MVNDTLDMKYVDLGVLEEKLKELFGADYEIEVRASTNQLGIWALNFIKDQHDNYFLTIPRKLEQVRGMLRFYTHSSPQSRRKRMESRERRTVGAKQGTEHGVKIISFAVRLWQCKTATSEMLLVYAKMSKRFSILGYQSIYHCAS
jgi:hypothetical protein